MKSNAPWSVKGIQRDARETAKEAARREGMTVGEWLSQMIYSQAEGGGAASLSGGEVEGLKLRDIVTAIEHLRNRAVEAESKNAETLSELSRTMGGFVERLQRLERVKPAEGSYPDIAARVEKLERVGGERNRIEALKALEKAVAQVAVQFNNAQRTTLTRLDSAEQQLQEFAERIDHVGAADGDAAGLSSLKTAIDGLAERVTRAERVAEEAAKLKSDAADSSDPEFVERTGARLRVLGDEIKRGGDQIRSLEGAIEKLSGQIEAAEKRSADGVQKVAETIAEVRSQLGAEDGAAGDGALEAKFEEARRETDERLEALQRSLAEVNARFEELGDAGAQSTEISSSASDAPSSNATPTALAAAKTVDATVTKNADSGLTQDPSIDDVVGEIEAAVAALEADDDASEQTSEDHFAFSDDDTDDEKRDAGDDFSFQLDEEESDGAEEEDITVSAPEIDDSDKDDSEESQEETNPDAQALLAEVRNALSSDGFAETNKENGEAGPEHDDDDISALFADDDDIPPSDTPNALDGNQDDEDEQAPNTASLAEKMSVDAGSGENAANDAPTQEEPKEDMLTAARRRAREAAAARSADSEGRPRRGQLTAKQRAILAARARQKRAAEAVAESESAETKPASDAGAADAPVSNVAEAEDDAATPQGRFNKITAALSSARARLRRNKDADMEDADSAEDFAPQPATADKDEDARGNNDRAALKTLQSTASARPLTLALAVAIILSVAALVYLVKDFIFQPEDAASRSPAAITLTPETTTDVTTGTSDTAMPDGGLVTVPEAPAIDPQVLFVESIDALNAATTEDDAMAAITTLQDAAALGYPPAQLQLGELFKTGQGVDQDLGQARVWFRRAANGGNVLAMHRIGVMTARGDGGAADPQEAVGWFRQAANYGLVDSQYNLGAIFHPSDDGAASAIQDAGEAYFWYSLAARNGDDQAEPLAAGVAVALSPEARAEIDARVADWAPSPADEAANANAITE